MFLLSLKSLKGKFFLLITTVVAIVIAFSIISNSENAKNITAADGPLDFSAETEAQRLYFISQLGLTVEKNPSEIKEILIPYDFDQTYTNYNEIQKQAGLNLELYKGCTAKKWTYTVTNYPGYEGKKCIKINLIIYRNRIIGGDICSVELNGFMKGLTKQEL